MNSKSNYKISGIVAIAVVAAIVGTLAFTSIQTNHNKAFDALKEYQSITNDWIFGYLTYDLKNDVEDLQSNNFDRLEFPEL